MAHEEGQLGLPFGALVGMVATGDELVDLVTVRVRARARARATATATAAATATARVLARRTSPKASWRKRREKAALTRNPSPKP